MENDLRTRGRLNRLAWWLDGSIRLPGGLRIGLDGIIGLIPGIGDAITAALSSYIIAEAARMNVPPSVLARMGMNVLLDLAIGSIPVVGDLFDFVFKANNRNVRLLEEYSGRPRPVRTQSRWILAGVIALLLLALAGIIALLKLLWTQLVH